jgi:uncharacterized membrane protein
MIRGTAQTAVDILSGRSRGLPHRRRRSARADRERPAIAVTSRWPTGRTETFSDGVFAIAVTLLVLNIQVPASDFRHLWHGILHQWPAYLGYATSFLTIGGIWLTHHAILRRLEYVNNTLMRLNLLLLMAVSFLPFPTKLMAQSIRNVDAERVAVIFYGASLLVASLLLSAMWRAIARRPALHRPEVTDREIGELLRAVTPSIGFYIAAGVLALAQPQLAVFVYLFPAVLTVLRARGDEIATAAPGRPDDVHQPREES